MEFKKLLNYKTEVTLCILGLILFLNLFSSESSQDQKKGMEPADSLKRVNEHLLMTNDQIEIEKIQRIEENKLKAPDLNSTRAMSPADFSEGSHLEYEQSSEILAEELSRSNKQIRNNSAESPHESIQNNILTEQEERKRRENDLSEYKQKIIEKARSDGWEIELSEDGKKITRYRRLRPKSSSKNSVDQEWGQRKPSSSAR